jgi:WD40 repeat protein/tRNA A-37 threonylcarbamoyl transferase component Bud32
MVSFENRSFPWPFEDRPRFIDESCDRYEDEWRAGRAPRIEDYLGELEGETRLALWLELVMLDQDLRRVRGESPTLADYRESCPDRMVWLDLSTDELEPIGEAGPGVRDATDDAPVAEPTAGDAERDRTMDRDEPVAADPAMTTAASPDQATDPHGLPTTAGPPHEVDASDLDGLALARPGAAFGDYDLLEKLGAGGMGVVFKARQKRLNRTVALKMIKAGVFADERQIRLFRSEAEAVAALDHPHIVPVLDSGEHRGVLFYSMRLVDGQDLGQCLDRYRDRPAAIARLVATVAGAIAHAHQRGVLHRDIKPSNILIDDRGEPHIIDFGLALRLEAAVESTTGNPAGTPGYMSPEQARGHRDEITTASDVYGLGTLLYVLLTGRPPFSGSSVLEILHHVIGDEPRRPRDRNPRADRDLEIICLKCLSKEPKDRYPSARELADDLNRWLDGRPIVARPASRAERAVKWVRRHKLVAALSGAAAIGAILGVSGLAWGLSAAVAARDEAIKGEDIARHHAYAAKLNLAARDWQDANIAQVLRHLDETKPPAGKSDLRGFEWSYLDRLARAQGRVLAGHAEVVASVAYSPDGSRVVSGDRAGEIKLWEAATGRLIRTMATGSPVEAVAFHPDGTRLASAGGDDGALILWDAATGQRIRTFPGHTKRVVGLAFSPDGKALASSSWDGTIKIRDAGDGSLVQTLADHRAERSALMDLSLAFLGDGKMLVSAGGGEPGIRIWDVATGRISRTFKDDAIHPRGVLAAGPDGKVLAYGGVNGTIWIRDVATGSVIHKLTDFHNRTNIRSLAFARDGKTLAAASDLGQVNLWDVATGDQVRIVKGHTSGISQVAFSPDGVHLASVSWDLTVRIWDTTRDQEARTLRGKDLIRAVAFSPDGSYLASGGLDRKITLWDVATGRAFRTLSGHTDMILSVAISPDGRRAASAGLDQTVRVWDVATEKEVRTLRGHADAVFAVAFSPDGKILASASDDQSVKLWDVEAGGEIRPLKGHIGAVRAVAFSQDGKVLATAGTDGFVLFWDPASGRRLRALQAGRFAIDSIVISPDGRWLASGGTEPEINVWDVATGAKALTLRGHALGVHKLAFSPDGRRLVSVGGDQTVRIWAPISGQELLVLRGHTEPIWGVAVSPDGRRIASAGSDAIKLWEADPASGDPR